MNQMELPPLHAIRVLELSTTPSAAYCGRLLAGLGAGPDSETPRVVEAGVFDLGDLMPLATDPDVTDLGLWVEQVAIWEA